MEERRAKAAATSDSESSIQVVVTAVCKSCVQSALDNFRIAAGELRIADRCKRLFAAATSATQSTTQHCGHDESARSLETSHQHAIGNVCVSSYANIAFLHCQLLSGASCSILSGSDDSGISMDFAAAAAVDSAQSAIMSETNDDSYREIAGTSSNCNAESEQMFLRLARRLYQSSEVNSEKNGNDLIIFGVDTTDVGALSHSSLFALRKGVICELLEKNVFSADVVWAPFCDPFLPSVVAVSLFRNDTRDGRVAALIWAALQRAFHAVLQHPDAFCTDLKPGTVDLLNARASLMLQRASVWRVLSRASCSARNAHYREAPCGNLNGLHTVLGDATSGTQLQLCVLHSPENVHSECSSLSIASSVSSSSAHSHSDRRVLKSRQSVLPEPTTVSDLVSHSSERFCKLLDDMKLDGRMQNSDILEAYFSHLLTKVFCMVPREDLCVLSMSFSQRIMSNPDDEASYMTSWTIYCRVFDPFQSSRIIVLPWWKSMHYGALVVDMESVRKDTRPRIWYLDSYQNLNSDMATFSTRIVYRIVRLFKFLFPKNLNLQALKALPVVIVDVPQQPAFSNACGLYALFFVQIILKIVAMHGVDALFDTLNSWRRGDFGQAPNHAEYITVEFRQHVYDTLHGYVSALENAGKRSQSSAPSLSLSLRDCYKQLNFDENATYEQIRASFKQMLVTEHPDKLSQRSGGVALSPEKVAAANEKFSRLESLYAQIFSHLKADKDDAFTTDMVPAAASPHATK